MGDRDGLVLVPPSGARLGGWLYNMVRPNIGTVAGGAWVWDDSAWLPWEVPYSANYTARSCRPTPTCATSTLPNGVSHSCGRADMSYELGYDDGERLKVRPPFRRGHAPEPLTSTGSTFGRAHHFDQYGRMHGDIVLHGERIEIDCLAFRDRTWGPRPENRPRQAAYLTGAADPDHGFLAVTTRARR